MTIRAKKIAAITRRRHEFFVLRRRLRFQLFCEQCAEELDFAALDDAVWLSGLTVREIVRRAENREIHYLESLGGHLFICQKSLTKIAARVCEVENSVIKQL